MKAQRVIEGIEDFGHVVPEPEDAPRPPVFLPRREVERRVGLSRTAIYERMARGAFPRPVRDLDTGSVWWVESEVIAWQLARIRHRDRGEH